ncbi:hypothetical protein C8R46DRAFT_1092876 [Mycena filopes]|nr:hypothetical protein C8R46DRAFT_1092876 [Mycena filopes]
MNPDFLAGAADVIDCFVHELGVLQGQLKEEGKRLSRSTEAAQDSEEDGNLELSVLAITKTALMVTRERLAKERDARKSLERELKALKEGVRGLRDGFKALAAQKDEMVATNTDLLQLIDERDSKLRELADAVCLARKDALEAQTERDAADSRLATVTKELSDLKTSAAAEKEQARKDADAAKLQAQEDLRSAQQDEQKRLSDRTNVLLAQSSTRLTARDQQLVVARKKLGLARSMTAKVRAQYQLLSGHHKSTKERLKAALVAERGEHEELKVTTRELIDLVEVLEAAVHKNWHSHSAENCKYQAKYLTVKAEKKDLKRRLSEASFHVAGQEEKETKRVRKVRFSV